MSSERGASGFEGGAFAQFARKWGTMATVAPVPTSLVTTRPQVGKTCLYTHFRGAKALFSYINLQVTDSTGGGGKAMDNFSFGGSAPVPPAGTCLLGRTYSLTT